LGERGAGGEAEQEEKQSGFFHDGGGRYPTQRGLSTS
jgi:hypothetical protein